MKHGFAEILLVALIAAAGIGVHFWRANRGLRVESQYRETVESTMQEVSNALGLEWRHENITVAALPGTRRNEHGYWARMADGEYKAGFSQPGRATAIVNPATMQLPGGLWSVLAHELAHVLMWQHGIGGDEHHDRMRRAGILWAQL